jgi:hypothetical protein
MLPIANSSISPPSSPILEVLASVRQKPQMVVPMIRPTRYAKLVSFLCSLREHGCNVM